MRHKFSAGLSSRWAANWGSPSIRLQELLILNYSAIILKLWCLIKSCCKVSSEKRGECAWEMQGIIGRNYPGKPLQGHGMGQKAGCKINTLKHKGGFWLLRDPLIQGLHKMPGNSLEEDRVINLFYPILSYIISYIILSYQYILSCVLGKLNFRCILGRLSYQHILSQILGRFIDALLITN